MYLPGIYETHMGPILCSSPFPVRARSYQSRECPILYMFSPFKSHIHGCIPHGSYILCLCYVVVCGLCYVASTVAVIILRGFVSFSQQKGDLYTCMVYLIFYAKRESFEKSPEHLLFERYVSQSFELQANINIREITRYLWIFFFFGDVRWKVSCH